MKEEQKKHLIDMMQEDKELGLYDIFNDEKRQGVKELIDAHKQGRDKIENDFLKCLSDSKVVYEPKQETIEEAAKNYCIKNYSVYNSNDEHTKDFIAGAKWQAERSYTEAIEFSEWIRIKDFQTASKDNWIGLDMKYYTTEELFEQFKKK